MFTIQLNCMCFGVSNEFPIYIKKRSVFEENSCVVRIIRRCFAPR